MLRPLSDLNLINRYDAEVDPALITSGDIETGKWVVKRGDAFVFEAGARDAVIVWTESNRDGTPGVSPDATANGRTQLSVLEGSGFRAETSVYKGTPEAGDLLKVDAEGDLVVIGENEENLAVATCKKAAYTTRHLWADHTVIEISTL